MTLRVAWLSFMAAASMLGGCSLAGTLHVGDVTLGLHNGFEAMGSHVGLFIH